MLNSCYISCDLGSTSCSGFVCI